MSAWVRCEELEVARSTAIFELTEERNKIHPRGVEPAVHQETLHELQAARARLAQKVTCLPSILPVQPTELPKTKYLAG